jgi:hypothetical protein
MGKFENGGQTTPRQQQTASQDFKNTWNLPCISLAVVLLALVQVRRQLYLMSLVLTLEAMLLDATRRLHDTLADPKR